MSLTVSPASIVEASDSPLLAAPESWPRRPLGEVAAILNGFTFSSKQFVATGGIPLIRIRDIFKSETAVGFIGEYDERYLVRQGDLLVGMDGDFNCVRWTGPVGLLNQRVCKVIPEPGLLDIDYLAVVLPGYLSAIHDLTSSTTVTHLSSKDVAQIPLPIPSLDEQRALAMVIGVAQSKGSASAAHLAEARRSVDRLRQAVLVAACTGRLTADWRETHQPHDSARDLVERSLGSMKHGLTRARAPAESWQGPVWPELPEEWEWAPMRDLAFVKGGIQKQPERTPKTNAYPYLRVANVLRGKLDLAVIHMFELFDGELDTYRLESGDLLVVEGNGSSNEIGRAAIWEGEIADCVHQNHIIRVRCLEMDPRFVELFWNSPIGSREVASLAVTSAGLYSLSTKKVGDIAVPVAPLEEQREVVRRALALLQHSDRLAERIDEASRGVDRSSNAVLGKALRGDPISSSTDAGGSHG